MTRILVERTYAQPQELVWRALTDAELLGRWLMPNDFEPRVGHHFTFRTDPAPGFDGVVRCEVLRLEAPRELAFSWVGGPIDTVVTFTLEPCAEGTRLRMEQSGFRGLKAWLVARILARGARDLYGRHLPELLERLDDAGRLRGGPPPPAECMSAGQRLLERLLGLFTPHRKDRR